MPSTSKKQHNFMEAVANNAAFAKKVGVPQSVGKEFESADKGKKFSSGNRADSQVANQPKTNHGEQALFKKGGRMATKGVNPFAKFEKSGKDKEMKGMKEGSKADMAMDKKQMAMKKGGMKKMATGGLAGGHKSADGVVSKGKTKAMKVSMPGNKGMKKGGMAKKYC